MKSKLVSVFALCALVGCATVPPSADTSAVVTDANAKLAAERAPSARPQLTRTVHARPGIIAQNNFGTKNIGPTAIDARWSNYGEYLRRMIETAQIEWERIIVNLTALPAMGSSVSVKFILNSEGKIAEIVTVDSTANRTATEACVSAITRRAPYGAWTDDMRAVLGDRQELTFTFYYQ